MATLLVDASTRLRGYVNHAHAEMVPFTFPSDGGEDEVREALFVCVPNLIAGGRYTLTHHFLSVASQLASA